MYETIGTIWVEEEDSVGWDAKRTNSIIQVRASVEQLQQQLYAIHEAMDQLNVEDIVPSQRVEEWVDHVQATLGSLMNWRHAEDIASRH